MVRVTCRLSHGASPWLTLLVVVSTLFGCDAGERGPSPATTSETSALPSVPVASSSTPRSSSAAAEPDPCPPADWGYDAWDQRTKWAGTLAEQNEALLTQLQAVHQLNDEQMQAIRGVFAGSEHLGQGNPEVTVHPVSVRQCLHRVCARRQEYWRGAFARICGARFMAPLYDPQTQPPERATACIDQFEFPNVPCAYPVTWVRASEAVALCHAMGKRLCDAHEWEGACEGRLTPPDYDFDTVRNMQPRDAVALMRGAHNSRYVGRLRWAYGDQHRKGICGTGSRKSEQCTTIGWRRCGTNTYPAGYFPDCRSPLGVYDQHGNAAEHMNLPLSESQRATSSSGEYGVTEMKGSWFIFDTIQAHHDYCRWRAPFWHGGKVKSPGSHRNYHLGFRCCKTVRPAAARR